MHISTPPAQFHRSSCDENLAHSLSRVITTADVTPRSTQADDVRPRPSNRLVLAGTVVVVAAAAAAVPWLTVTTPRTTSSPGGDGGGRRKGGTERRGSSPWSGAHRSDHALTWAAGARGWRRKGAWAGRLAGSEGRAPVLQHSNETSK